MSVGRLSALQTRVLHVLAGLRPRWTLTGGGALAAVYTKHRETRDLDLFWHAATELGSLPREVASLLKSDGFVVESVQSSPAFHRYRALKGDESVLIDLVADPVPTLEEPREFFLEGVAILVDTEREILVNKLCTLLERSELRDLQDVRILLEAGGDLERGLAQAPEKDAGFSPLTFAWVLRELPITSLGLGSGWPIEEVASLERFRDDLVQTVARLAKPE